MAYLPKDLPPSGAGPPPDMIETVRRALGRTAPLSAAPVPPVIDESITRLVHTDIGLPELFARTARDNKIGVTQCYVEELLPKLVEFLKSQQVRSIALPASRLLAQLKIAEELAAAGFTVFAWESMTLDALYDVDCGLTDVWCAVAEVGGLVIRGAPEHGRALSLVPRVHVAILEPRNFIPDLVDLFQRTPADENDKFVIITGPSKTSDIEMSLVVGVHGPTVVQVFSLQ